MSLESIAIDSLPAVEAELNYTVPMAEKPRDYAYDPPPGVPHSNSTLEPRRFAIHDMRPVAARISLDSHGFAAIRHRSALRYFCDEDEIRRTYYPEAEALLKEVTGADRVLIFDHTIRRHIPGTDDRRNLARQPAREVHVDQTVSRARNGCATCCRPKRKSCCAAASRSSTSGGRSMGPSRMPRWRSAMR